MYIDHESGLRMRAIREEDLEPLRLMHNHPDTLFMLSDTTFITPTMQREWFRSLRGGASRRCVIEQEATGELLALVKLDGINSVDRIARIGLDVVVEKRGQGFGTACFKLLLRWSFEELNLNMVWLLAAEFNEPALGLYRKLGFSETGRLPQALYRHGEYHDMLLFALLRKDWET